MNSNKALFLDRDGTINKEKNYIYRIEDIEFIDGIFDICSYFSEKGFLLIVVTNQAGIGRGLYTEKDYNILTGWMMEEFQKNGIKITAFYHCPYHPEFGLGPYKKESDDRKPNPGMLLKAQRSYNIDMGNSLIIGDKDTDMLAGKNAEIPYRILLSEAFSLDQQKGNQTHIIHQLKELINIYDDEISLRAKS